MHFKLTFQDLMKLLNEQRFLSMLMHFELKQEAWVDMLNVLSLSFFLSCVIAVKKNLLLAI